MKKVFWTDPYCHILNTRVVELNGNIATFDKTIAYSFAGAQESDSATIDDLKILDSIIDGKLIRYILPENHGLVVGQEVVMKIDWPRRLKLMRLHFAAELILELIKKNFGLKKVGAHIAEHKARIDFKSGFKLSDAFPILLHQYEKIIKENLPIIKGFSDETAQKRFWRIEGFAEVPCGGTHVATTGEVGFLELKRVNPGKGIERVEIYLK